MSDDLHDLVRENNKILRSLRGKERRKSFIGLIKIALIVAAVWWLYSILQPVYEKLIEVSNSVENASEEMKSLKESASESKFFDFFTNEQ